MSCGTKRRFVCPTVGLVSPPGPPRKQSAPKLAALGALTYADQGAPPSEVQRLVGDSRAFFAIDVETHMLAPENKLDVANGAGSLSVFKKTTPDELAHLRLVQIGWAVGDVRGGEPRVRELLVKPVGYEIHSKAADKHGITQDHASSRGLPLREVLSQFLAEFEEACRQGARVTAFNLDFDAAVVRHELAREGLVEELAEWDQKTSEGLCTMHPEICKWVTGQRGGNALPSCSLNLAVRTLLPEHVGMLQSHHNAGNDSHMHWLLCKALARETA